MPMTLSSSTATQASTGALAAPRRGRGLCTFWLGERHFGLDVALAAEVVTVDRVAPVPMAPPSVRGLFNLRGTPVALLELGMVLGLEDVARHDARAVTALVVRDGDLLVAFVIDRMEAVVSESRGTFTEAGTDDHAAVRGFLELDGAAGRVVTVLEPAVLLERLEAVRFVKDEE
jgi:purine-binding chemotaxis protein CheW